MKAKHLAAALFTRDKVTIERLLRFNWCTYKINGNMYQK